MENSPWYSQGLHFKCTGCGQCCTGSPGAVWVSQEEIGNMAAHMRLSPEEFQRRYVRQLGGRLSLTERSGNYDCVFLRDKKCTIYEIRPLQCRTFPWWPGVLSDRESWENTAKMCEGISCSAPLIPFEEIKKTVALHDENRDSDTAADHPLA